MKINSQKLEQMTIKREGIKFCKRKGENMHTFKPIRKTLKKSRFFSINSEQSYISRLISDVWPLKSYRKDILISNTKHNVAFQSKPSALPGTTITGNWPIMYWELFVHYRRESNSKFKVHIFEIVEPALLWYIWCNL